jgi:3'(2'), 5'-bisphosphate nucleotidase
MQELEVARSAALLAGDLLRRHQRGDRNAVAKPDGSPVTQADTEANEAILASLRRAFPNDAILSEESADDGTRSQHSRVWLVDPLDGTRDFVAGSPEFAVHIALTVQGRPTVAVVYQPATDGLFEAVAGEGAFVVKGATRRRLSVSKHDELIGLRLGVSRYTPGPALRRLLSEAPFGLDAVPMGASTKLLAVAQGLLDACLTLHDGEHEWDSCAPGLVVTEAGGRITDVAGTPLRYNQADVRHRRGVVVSNRQCHDPLCRLAARYWPLDDATGPSIRTD